GGFARPAAGRTGGGLAGREPPGQAGGGEEDGPDEGAGGQVGRAGDGRQPGPHVAGAEQDLHADEGGGGPDHERHRRRRAPAPGVGAERGEPAGATSTTREMSTATRLIATSRWATTDSALRSRCTTMAPRIACDSTIGRGMTARVKTRRDSARWFRTATTARATVSQMTTEAVARCEYSMMAWYSSGGRKRPWRRGQSGQASPGP